jgi:hypothetical protein
MAVIKEVEVRGSGLEATYWRITSLDTNYMGRNTKITLSGYATQELRQSGKLPVTSVTMTVNELLESRSVAYARLKSPVLEFHGGTELVDVNDFADATDA